MNSAVAEPSREPIPHERVLLLDPDRGAANALADVLRDEGIETTVLPSAHEVDIVGPKPLVAVNYDGTDATTRERLLDGSLLPSPYKPLLYSNRGVRPEFSDVFGRWRFTNLVATGSGLDPAEFVATIRKLLGGEIFGIDRYFRTRAIAESIIVTRSSERHDVLDRIADFADCRGVRGRLAALLLTVGDELLTNALYNAPLDVGGTPRYAHVARTNDITLEPGEYVLVELRADETRIGVSVTDPFGSLPADRILQQLAKCFRRGPDQVEEKSGGAGLGFYQTFEAVSHLVFNLSPMRKTEAMGIVNVRGSYREFAARGKSFNIFVGESQ